jgi:hypothetical protein
MKRIRRYLFALEDGESPFLKRRVSSYPGRTQINYFIHSNAGVYFALSDVLHIHNQFTFTRLLLTRLLFVLQILVFYALHYTVGPAGFCRQAVSCLIVTLPYFCPSRITPVSQYPRSCKFFGSSVKDMFSSSLWCTWLSLRYPH